MLQPLRVSALRLALRRPKLSDRDVEKLLAGPEIKEFVTPDKQEVAGYAQTMETIFAHCQDTPLTKDHIKQLRRDLLQ